VQLSITIHPSWQSVPVALSRVLLALQALEKPRQPGDDGDDLTELLAGMDDPEPAPAVPAAAVPSPARATPPATSRAFDGVPTTGPAMYRWACSRKSLPEVNRIGKRFGYPPKVSEWLPI